MSVRLSHISKRYSSGGGEREVLRGVSLELAPGKSLAIMGPSGSGKSTLLHICGGLDAPSSGEVEIFGQKPFSLSENALAAFRAGTIGFVFQAHHLLPQCSLLENVILPSLALKDGKGDPRERARRLLERAGLSARMNARPSECSGGECQRAAVVRALINGPKLLLADEPTGSLDHASSQAVVALLKELQQADNFALIVVTHAADVAAQMDSAMKLQDGALVPIPRDKP